jgi:Taurine catabolism dioxygenase TauD, TfdA family
MSTSTIPEDAARLQNVPFGPGASRSIQDALRGDRVALVRGVSPQLADTLVHQVAQSFGLEESLQIQAGFAEIEGHRSRSGKYFMSVAARTDYQFIAAHSEGSHFSNMHLAAFYCHENTTDGGETILLNADSDRPGWQQLRELRVKASMTGNTRPTPGQMTRMRVAFGMQSLDDAIDERDRVLGEDPSPVPGIAVHRVLSPIQKCHSRILDRPVHVYWDSVGSIDLDSAHEYANLLTECGLFRKPPGATRLEQLDNAASRRLWSSGVRYVDLFRSRLTIKLKAGELAVMNNTTWTHSTANWTPSSGHRKVVAAFA